MDKFQRELLWLSIKKRLDEKGLCLLPSTEELVSELIPPQWPKSDMELAVRYMIEPKQIK